MPYALSTLGDLDLRSDDEPLHVGAAGHHAAKRGLDLLIGLPLLLMTLPLLLGVALAVACSGRGGVLFRQTRIGRGGRPFTMLKFRTMRPGAASLRDELAALDEGNGVLFKIKRDPRVTAIGRILRRFSLDELPQLINVVRGEMSLVGPRPALPEEVLLYSPLERCRLAARPGLTGLWQVSGRSDLSWEQSVGLDLHYVRHASAPLDLTILCRTFSAVVFGRGAY
ncbi:MAG: exopolysaccharide biosynthesis polyprenyl glycosylphosphotransferase [Frankiales bacterium]|nr:exopolysaccharide biosynthesis polyprenyl glycosylphosphotransferase [Frankiales bacterium]